MNCPHCYQELAIDMEECPMCGRPVESEGDYTPINSSGEPDSIFEEEIVVQKKKKKGRK